MTSMRVAVYDYNPKLPEACLRKIKIRPIQRACLVVIEMRVNIECFEKLSVQEHRIKSKLEITGNLIP